MMKLFNLPSSIAFASLFWTASNATIKIKDLPSQLHAGSNYPVVWSNDRDYHIQDLALYNFDNGVSWGSRVSTIDHYINSTKGTNSGLLRVRATVKNHGYYSLVMNAWEVNNETGIPDPSAVAYTSSNMFIIYGGPELHPKEIAGVVIGSFVVLVLVAGAFVGVAWYVRRRGSWAAAAGFSGGNGGRYTDAA